MTRMAAPSFPSATTASSTRPPGSTAMSSRTGSTSVAGSSATAPLECVGSNAHAGTKKAASKAATNSNANILRIMIASSNRHSYLLLPTVQPYMSRPQRRGPVSLALRVAAPVQQCAAVDVGPLVVFELVAAEVRHQHPVLKRNLGVGVPRHHHVGQRDALDQPLHRQRLAADELGAAGTVRVIEGVHHRIA